ncbi:unnamed protein product, partial [marine sediment metagenome]
MKRIPAEKGADESRYRLKNLESRRSRISDESECRAAIPEELWSRVRMPPVNSG